MAEIDAKVGGFGIVPEALNDSIVSSHYFLFVVAHSTHRDQSVHSIVITWTTAS